MIIGYARCSTTAQDLAPQLEALKAAGAEHIFSEHESGAKRERPQLDAALAALKPGDLLITTKIDRLARSTLDFCQIVDAIQKRGAAFRSIGDSVDTSTPMGRALMGILAVFAELERTRILERTAEGQKRARAAGVRFGKAPKLSPMQLEEVRRRWNGGKGESPTHLARVFRVGRSTIQRAVGIL